MLVEEHKKENKRLIILVQAIIGLIWLIFWAQIFKEENNYKPISWRKKKNPKIEFGIKTLELVI